MLLALVLLLGFEPSEVVSLVWGKDLPRVRCVGKVCGFTCVTAGASTVCAKTPVGVCLAKDGKAKCFDPPSAALCADGREIRRPACLADSGELACGYDCKATAGKVACATTPRGSCNAMSGNVICSDPVVDPGASTACFRRSS